MAKIKMFYSNKSILFFFVLFSALLCTACVPKDCKDCSFTLGGSTTVALIVRSISKDFRAQYPSYQFSYESTGSSAAGIRGVLNGDYIMGGSSRELKQAETIVNTIAIARDGIAVLAHRSSGVNELSKEQLKLIYTGQIVNWSEVGSQNAPISVFIRQESSGTRSSFDEMILGQTPAIPTAPVTLSNTDMALRVGATDNSIGYISFAYLNQLNEETTQVIRIDGYAATEEKIPDAHYVLSRTLYIVYKGELDGFKKIFTDYLLSSKGQKAIQEANFLPIQ